MLTIPNILTFFRILAVLPMAVLVMLDQPWAWATAIGLFIAAAISDFLDGYFARRLNQYSDLGRILDPIADKILIGVMLPVLAASQHFFLINMIAMAIIMMREFLISGLREDMAGRQIPLAVSVLAKWKTTVQLLATGLLIAAGLWPVITGIANASLWIAAILTAITGGQYLFSCLKILSDDKADIPAS